MSDTLTVLTGLAALNTGVAAGLFFAFSTLVMRGLGALPPGEGSDAMRSINRSVYTPGFMLGFVGPAVFAVLLGGWWIADREESPYLLAGAVLYLLGAIVVSGRFNIPRNDALEKTGRDDEAFWRRYLVEWVRWNHVRLASSVGASGCYLTALATA